MKKLAVFLLSAFAAALLLSGCSQTSPAVGNYVFDTGDFLTADQEQQINSQILELRNKAQADFIVVFTDSPASDDYRKEAESAINTFIASGGGYGKDKEVVCFYADMANRQIFVDEYNVSEDWKISNAEIDSIVQGNVRDYMSQSNYYGAASTFVDGAYKAARPGFFGRIGGWLTTGLAGGGIFSGIMIGKQKKKRVVSTTHYRKESAIVPTYKQDFFAGTTTEVRHIERSNSSDSDTTPASSGSNGHHGGGASF